MAKQLKIEMADTDKVEAVDVKPLLRFIAPYMRSGRDVQDWVDHCFVSDESNVGDFMLDAEAMASLSEQLGFAVKSDDRMWQVAEKMHAMNKHTM